MKIALYVPSWPAGVVPNGIVTYASYLVPALRQLGHEVFVLTYAAGEPSDPYTIDLKRFSRKFSVLDRARSLLSPETAPISLTSIAIVRAIRELVAKQRIDVFEIEESFGWSYSVSRLRLIPVVVRLHGPWFLSGNFDQLRNENKIAWEGRGIRHATYVTTGSAETLNAVKRYYGLDLSLSRVIPNPIEPAREREIWRGDACSTESILFVGRFDKIKGGDVVLRAFERLATMFPNAMLTFVGPDRGIGRVDGQKIFFRRFIQENIPEGVRSRINFRGQVGHAEVMSLRTQNNIAIIAARYETQGYAVMEAMSRGCPLVATAVGGIPEFVKDRRNGLIVPSDDEDAMAAACKELLENKVLAAKIGRQAWLDCRKLYDPENVAKQMVSVYQDAIAAAGTSI